jgi:uncharacterized protein YdeI (YjbR/CyaY-like superfamily)
VTPKDDLPVMPFASAAAWESWLDAFHAESAGVWLQIAKKGSGIPTVTYAEALEVALCYGWIDGQKASHNADYFLQRFTPRRTKSKWSKINVDKVAELTKAGRMRPAGVAEVEAAKADGRWDRAYGGSKEMTIPPDLQAAIDAEPKAKAMLDKLSAQNRFALAFRTHNMKTEAGRKKKIADLVAMLKRGETIHPQKK